MNPSRGRPPLDGRTAAALAVADALTGQRFVSEALRDMRSSGRLTGRESGLAMQVGLGAIRHLITIEHVLGRVAKFDRTQTKPKLRAILCTATYQIIWMDRIPPSAAVNQAVELARRLVRGRTPGMVNAILRRLAGAIETRRVAWQRGDPTHIRVDWKNACKFITAVLPSDDEIAHIAAATGEPTDRFATLVARHGMEDAEAIAWASQAIPATVLQRNALHWSAEEFERTLSGTFGDAVEFAEGAAFVSPATPVADTPAFINGMAFVQDLTAHTAAMAVPVTPGAVVLDLCAAPGGKTVVLAMRMNDDGTVVACDSAPDRLALVTGNARRLALRSIRTRLLAGGNADLSTEPHDFNAALVDVPCSNTGVVARRPEARLGLTTEKLGSLVTLQQELLDRAAQRVQPNGTLVYSTCSIEPEENEQLVAAFLDRQRAWQLDVESTTLPTWGARLSDWRDGGYYARLVRRH